MACKGICNQYSVKGIAIRDWNYDPNLMRCSLCDVIINEKDWIRRDSGKLCCPCCGMQLKRNSRGKRAREKRQLEFLQKIEAK